MNGQKGKSRVESREKLSSWEEVEFQVKRVKMKSEKLPRDLDWAIDKLFWGLRF